MMKKIVLLFSMSVLILSQSFSQGVIGLRYNENGKFRIAQFTDTHLKCSSDKHEETLNLIKDVLSVERPDFVVITGDLIAAENAEDCLLKLVEPLANSGRPWTVTFGNHDVEYDITKEDMWALLEAQPGFVGEKGAISGVGNNIFALYASADNNILTTIYTMDSHAYTGNKDLLGTYDWIKFDQVNWFRAVSDQFEQMAGKPIPSLVFFHIPLKEYREVGAREDKVGVRGEDECNSNINSGLFASMVEKKNVMGVFVGHDHDNNYIGLQNGIALGYGQVTGYDAYGDLDRGARIIELDENKPGEFTTWIVTSSGVHDTFHYPDNNAAAE